MEKYITMVAQISPSMREFVQIPKADFDFFVQRNMEIYFHEIMNQFLFNPEGKQKIREFCKVNHVQGMNGKNKAQDCFCLLHELKAMASMDKKQGEMLKNALTFMSYIDNSDLVSDKWLNIFQKIKSVLSFKVYPKTDPLFLSYEPVFIFLEQVKETEVIIL